jgi:hypothetical protein
LEKSLKPLKGECRMSYIPKLAIELQPFTSVEEMNHHMNLHYLTFKHDMTDRFNEIFFLIKKYACLVAGVCWLKQESIASLAGVSVKTVERAVKIFKELGVMKIYHTKRANGLNGNCYYVLQPFQGELVMDDEEISMVEEGNVGAVEEFQTVGTDGIEGDFLEDKLLISSNKTLLNSSKALESSNKTKKEEIDNNARVESKINPLPIKKQQSIHVSEEDYECLVLYLTNRGILEKDAKKIIDLVLHTCVYIKPSKLLNAIAKAEFNYQKRLKYEDPIMSVVDYFVKLVLREMQGGGSTGTYLKLPS